MFHRHKWSKWKMVKVTLTWQTRHGIKEVISNAQKRVCESCGKTQRELM